jgi:hypothetical protein
MEGDGYGNKMWQIHSLQAIKIGKELVRKEQGTVLAKIKIKLWIKKNKTPQDCGIDDNVRHKPRFKGLQAVHSYERERERERAYPPSLFAEFH